MPAVNESNVRHLLRRAEFVDRPARVTALLAKATWAEVVDDVMAISSSPPSVTFRAEDENWQRGEHLSTFWLDQMAFDSTRPLLEKMAWFWHGHFCSEFGKVNSAELMREQIDLFRRSALGNVRQLAKDMSIQVAMLRYLDNNENKKTSPNQNFGRELLELFLLGVGNYTEGDVESSTAAWTGHGDDWESDQYIWRNNWHDFTQNKPFLGTTINTGTSDAAGRLHGFDVIDVVLGSGTVPASAAKVENRGRPTREVAAEFLSRKLWFAFADLLPPPGAMAAMRTALLDNDFAVRPWVRAMLLHDDFYTDGVRAGLVRPPIEYAVHLLAASNKRADGGILWLMDGMGQRPLFPPNVSGWKWNSYWINVSAMEWRARGAQHAYWYCMRDYWSGAKVLRLPDGNIPQSEVVALSGTWPNQYPTLTDADFVDRILSLTRLRVSSTVRTQAIAFCAEAGIWGRPDVLLLLLLAPDHQMA